MPEVTSPLMGWPAKACKKLVLPEPEGPISAVQPDGISPLAELKMRCGASREADVLMLTCMRMHVRVCVWIRVDAYVCTRVDTCVHTYACTPPTW